MRKRIQTVGLTVIFLLIIINSCKKEEPPTVKTYETRNIGTTVATSGGQVSNAGSGSVTARGVCWSTESNPTISGSKTLDGSGVGDYDSQISGLGPATTYYVRAYATNSSGTGYGEVLSFKTTGNAPAVTSLQPLLVYTNEATLAARINPYFVASDVSFEYGGTTGYGNSVTYNKNPVTYDHSIAMKISGLTPGTTYHFRVKAVNSLGTTYGNDMTFNTTQPLLDIDGNSYNTVTIGSQTWTNRNLETTRFSDGTEIPLVSDDNTWTGLQSPGFCWYNNDDSQSKGTYGALYNWYAVANGNACPSGYHVPAYEEWNTLMTFLDGNQFCFEIGSMGMALASDTGWTFSSVRTAIGNTDYPEYRNTIFFLTLPAGVRDADLKVFRSRGEYSAFWTSTEESAQNAIVRDFSYDQVYSNLTFAKKEHGYSIRCLKD
jgi:uncharacterized protein (TIGR02145 family)